MIHQVFKNSLKNIVDTMIFSDHDFKERLKKDLIITPVDIKTQLGPSSMDLRLGNRFRQFKMSDHAFIDPANYNDRVHREWTTENGTKVTECEYSRLYEEEKPFIIHPGDFILASILEHVEIPNDLIGHLEGRSSLGRMGLMVHSTAGYIDPGFKGNITLELANVGKLPIKLYPKMRVCQIVIQKLLTPCDVPYGVRPGSKYLNEKGATQSRIEIDFKKD